MFQDDNIIGTEGKGAGQSLESVLGAAPAAVEAILEKINLGVPKILQASTDNIIESLKKYEDGIATIQKSFLGGGREFENNIRQAFAAGEVAVVRLGGKLSDVENIQKNISDTLNTNFILQDETYGEIYAAAQLTAGSTQEATAMSQKLIGTFKEIGMSVFDVGKKTGEIINYVKSLGVNANEVVTQLNVNMAKLNMYNFSEGVNGMAKMATQAAMVRVDMGTTLNVAETLLKPEKAIEMAAGLQRLGVQVTSLLDPLTLMDMSLNDPAKLQDSIIEMTKSLTYFDEKNQKISILPGEQLKLRELATVLNINVNELTKMAIGSGELEEKMKRIKIPTLKEQLSPEGEQELKTMIANLGQLKDGKLMISVPGQKEMVEASQLTEEQIEKLRKRQEDEQKTTEQLLVEANGYFAKIVNEGIALKTGVARAPAASENVLSYVKAIGESFSKTMDNVKADLSKTLQDKGALGKKEGEMLDEGQYTLLFGSVLDKLVKPAAETFVGDMLKKMEGTNVDFSKLIEGADGASTALFNFIDSLEFSSESIRDGLQNLKDKVGGKKVTTAGDFIKFPDEDVITLPEDTIFGATTKGDKKFGNLVNPPNELEVPKIETNVNTNVSTEGKVSGTIVLKIETDGNMNLSSLETYLNNPVNQRRLANDLYPLMGKIQSTKSTLED